MSCFLDLVMHIFIRHNSMHHSYVYHFYYVHTWHFCTKSLCYHAHSSSMFLCATNHIPYVAISHYVHSCIFLHVVTHALHSFFIIKVTKKQKVYTAFLTACIRYHGNICKQTMMPNALWIRKDGLSSVLCQLINSFVMHSITMP